MDNREIKIYTLAKTQPVLIVVYYAIGDNRLQRGYYYSATPFDLIDSDINPFRSSIYEKSQILIKTANKFTPNQLRDSRNQALGKYYEYLYKEIDIKPKEFDYFYKLKDLEDTLKKYDDEYEYVIEEDDDEEIKNDIFNTKIDYDISLNNVILNTDTKNNISQVINFLKNKEMYDRIGAKMPRGILLYGPPGTGKTTIARTIAKETNSEFYNVAGCEFIEKFVGVGAKRIRKLFEKAKNNSSSIIFIDEVDAIGAKRDSDTNEERDQTLNQLLVELDGFNQLENVIVIAATNRLDLLDEALIRPGRFDRKLFIGLPNEENRYKLFELFLKDIITDSNIDYNLLSMITENYSGADIANICNESAIKAVNENREYVMQSDLEYMIEKNQNNNSKKRNIGFI